MKNKTYAECRESFVRYLKSVRHRYGMTQEKFAEAIGVNESTYKKVERNIIPPSLEFLLSLRNFLESPIDCFLCDDRSDLEQLWAYVDNATETDQLLIVVRLARKFGTDKIYEFIGNYEGENKH